MFNIFTKKHIPHPDGLDSTSYRPGVVFDGGAEHLAYINIRPHPILTQFAGFIPHRQYQVKTPQVVYQYNALPIISILPGIQAGQVQTLPLLENGQLSGNINNALTNNSLFGGVQS